jgi:Permuted papain-like amidase enzyme, YaeF/YiiX, C92 family
MRRQSSYNSATIFRGRLCAVCLLALFGAGCALPTSPTMATVPKEWRRTNPWSPQANAARADGRLVPLFYNQAMAQWAEFGRRNIEEGDILFRYGKSYKPYENFTSRVIAGIEDNRYSHDGIAHWEGDTLYIYDAEPLPQATRKIPFEFWVLDVADRSLVIKRLKPEFQCYIPKAVAYCEDVYQKQIPFDDGLNPDDERLYCSEMIEKAYRSAGLVLSETVPITCLPHYQRWLPIKPLVTLFTPIQLDRPVFALGNAYYGTYGSPLLETVYEQSPDKKERERTGPTCHGDAAPGPSLAH